MSYGFQEATNYDIIFADSYNDYCGSTDGKHLIQSKTVDGEGQIVYGEKVTSGNTSYADQGATRGTDYAYIREWDS